MIENSPIFILASERSGTNLLRRRLTESQNEYFGPSPAHFLKHLLWQEYKYGDLDNDAAFLKLIEHALQLCYIHFSPWEVQIKKEEVLEEFASTAQARNCVQLSHFLMTKYANFKGYKSYICKDNNLFDYAAFILLQIPHARFIYLCRDPRDVVLSEYKRSLATDSLTCAASTWHQEQLKSLAWVKWISQTRPGQMISVKYEDLIQDEVREIRRILDFYQLPYNPRLEPPPTDLGSAEEWSNLNKPTLKNNSKKFLRDLTASQIALIEAETWNVMTHLGYEPTNQRRPRISRIKRWMDRLFGHLSFRLRTQRLKFSRDENWKLRWQRSTLLEEIQAMEAAPIIESPQRPTSSKQAIGES